VQDEMNVPASIRQTRGLEAAAACGQLRNNYQKDPMAASASASKPASVPVEV